MKKLCLLIPSHWTANMGGAEMQARMLLARLVALGRFDIHYVTRNVARTYVPEGYSVHRITARRIVAGTFLLDSPGVARLLDDIRPDIVYQRVGCTYTGIAARYALRARQRMIWHVSSDRDLTPLPWSWSWRSPFEQLNRAAIEYGARNADAVVVQNHEQQALLHRHHGRSDAIRIPNFHPDVQSPPMKSAGITVCWIANIKNIKRPELFVRLASDFQHRPDMKFVMIGFAPPGWNQWIALLKKIEKLPNFHYLGAKSQQEVNKLLAASHILVNTSSLEGFPNTFIQAWLHEASVVSMSANPDGVFDNDLYGLCAHESYDRLRQAVDRLAADAALRGEIAGRALQFARRSFSETNIDRLIAVLEGT